MMRSTLALLLACSTRLAFAQEATDPPADEQTQPAPPPAEPAPPPAPTATTSVAPASPAVEPAPVAVDRFPRWQQARLVVDLELYTHARLVRRTGDDLSELRLDRGEIGARVGVHRNAAAELRLEAIRSAQDGGALGIDGNTTVIRIKRAQLIGTHSFGELRLDGAIGFAADPWIATLERDYSIKPLSRTGSERFLDWPTSDLAFVAAASYGPVRAAVSAGNGEGLRYPERNTGKTITGVVEIVPVATDTLRVGIAAVGRDGSQGVASVRDRRIGGGVTVVTPWVRGGGELVQAWGLADNGGLEGLLVDGWAEARIVPSAFVAARGATLGFANNGGRLSSFGGAIAVEPWRATGDGRVRLWLAVDRVTASGAAMPLPGADPGDATLLMLIASILAPYSVN